MTKMKLGYYLVRESDEKYFFISKNPNEDSLSKVASKALSDNNYKYWIDKCIGFDFNENPCWLNIDCSNSFGV